MNEHDDLRAELLDYCFGAHEEPERIEALLERDSAARALHAEVRASAALLERAARETAPDLELAPATSRRPGKAWRRFRVLAAAALVVALAVPGALWGAKTAALARVEDGVLRLVVSGPPGLPDGASARFRVETWSDGGAPRPATVSWRALDAEGQELFARFVESDGAVDVDLPATLAGARRLVVTAKAGETEREASLALSPHAAAPLAHLATDKPAYRPGEPLRLRAVLLDRRTLAPLAGTYRFRLVDAKDVAVESFTQAAEHGVVARTLTVPPDAAGGTWAFELRDAANELTVERLELVVRRYEAPRLAKTLQLDRKTYAPGASGAAELAVLRVEGGPAAGATVTAMLVVDGAEVARSEHALDARGRCVVPFTVPARVERGEARLVARVTDGGVVESAIEPFVVPTGGVEAALWPEGGELVAGVEGRVYVELTDVLDRPVSGRGRVVDGAGRTVAPFATEHEGRGRFTLTPELGVRYALVLDEPAPRAEDARVDDPRAADPDSAGSPGASPAPHRFELPSAVSAGVGLRARADSTPAGAPLALAVATPHPGPWIAAAFCRGDLVAQDAFEGAGLHALELVPDETVAGVLRVTVFDAELRPVAERLVHRESARRIDVALTPEKAVLAPGEAQTLAVTTTDEAGRPVPAVVGLTVADRAVRDLVGLVRVGLADATWLTADVGALEEARPFLAQDAEARRNVDLLLGTLGWRRFAWREPQAFLAEHGDEAKRVLVREGRPQVPAVADTSDEDAAALATARRAARHARERALGIAIAAGLALAVLVLLRLVWRASERLWPAAPRSRPLAATGLVALIAVGGLLALVRATGGPGAVGAEAVPAFLAAAVEREEGAPAAELALDGRGEVGADDQDLWLGAGAPQPEVAFARPDLAAGVAGPGAAPAPAPVANAGVPMQLERLQQLGYAEAAEAEPGFLADDRVADARAFRPASKRVAWGREYAHRRTGGPERHDFTETVYWNALLVTDAAGRASVAFDTSDAVTTWVAHADAHGPVAADGEHAAPLAGRGRVGQGRASFEAKIPFRLEAKLPVEATDGDRFELPVAAVSETPGVTSAALRASASGPLVLGLDATEIALVGGRGRALLPLEVRAPGTGADASGGSDGGGGGAAARLVLDGTAGRFGDRVERGLRVVPRGFPHRVSRSGRVTAAAPAEAEVALPDDLAPGSLTCAVTLYPSPLADLADGLDGLLQEPHGCFEQASSANYPNVLALAFLEATGADAPAMAARSRELLERGYAKIAGYECSERGYEWFGGNPGHEALTAYGLLEFHDMARVFDVDAAMVARTREWLLARRDGEGGYRRNERALDSFGRAPQAVTDAYCTFALAVTGTEPENLGVELDRAEARALASDDPYEVALAAGALQAAGRLEPADAARERLARMQRPDGSLAGTTTSITSSGARDLAVETTSLAILAWLDDPGDAARVERALGWLLGERQPGGRFGATQATILALKALVAHAETAWRAAAPGAVRVYVNDRLAERVEVRAEQRGAIEVDLAGRLASGANRVRVELEGENDFPWALELAYHADRPADAPDAPLALSTRLARTSVTEGETVACEIAVSNRGAEGLPMTIAIVGLPAGLEAPTEVLRDLLDAGRFDFWEVRGREVVLYWRGLGPEETKRVTLDCLARVPGTTTGPASRAHPYYAPDAVRWAEPLRVRVAPAGTGASGR